MRITQSNVENIKDYIEQITDVAEDLSEACDAWLEGLEDPDVDADDHRDNRETIEEHFETILDVAKSIVTLNDKNALYESGRDKKLKARVAELEKLVEEQQAQLFAYGQQNLGVTDA